jgi:large subunit ribosomal protein L6
MSRVAKAPVAIPSGVEVTLDSNQVKIKGPLGQLEREIHAWVKVEQDGDQLVFRHTGGKQEAVAMTGTFRALVNNMVQGVSKGFARSLALRGVCYRAQAQGQKLNLTLGFSHPVEYQVPQGITVETPSNTEVVVKGIDKQLVGEVAAKIRAYRPPEPYKGKGVRYQDERVVLKEAKKK